MKVKLLILFSLCSITLANAQCNVPPPPGLAPVYALDMDNDGFAVFDIQYYIDHFDRPALEDYFGINSSGYDPSFQVNMVSQPFLYTNTVQGELASLRYDYNGSGPQLEPQPPCYWPVEFYFGSRGLLLITIPFDGDFDSDGISNYDEDANRNGNLMDDDDDNDGLFNFKDNLNNLANAVHENIQLSVYPNPITNGKFAFDSNVLISEVMVYDLTGKQLYNAKISSNEVNLANIAVGVYLLKFQSENGSIYKKIVIN